MSPGRERATSMPTSCMDQTLKTWAASTASDCIAEGIRAAAARSADDRVLYSTTAGELSNARPMGETGIYDVFEGVDRYAREQK